MNINDVLPQKKKKKKKKKTRGYGKKVKEMKI